MREQLPVTGDVRVQSIKMWDELPMEPVCKKFHLFDFSDIKKHPKSCYYGSSPIVVGFDCRKINLNATVSINGTIYQPILHLFPDLTEFLHEQRGYLPYMSKHGIVKNVQCLPVQCRVRPTDNCYPEHLPVSCDGEDVFLHGESRAVANNAVPIECNKNRLSAFQTDDEYWICLGPGIVPCLNVKKAYPRGY